MALAERHCPPGYENWHKAGSKEEEMAACRIVGSVAPMKASQLWQRKAEEALAQAAEFRAKGWLFMASCRERDAVTYNKNMLKAVAKEARDAKAKDMPADW